MKVLKFLKLQVLIILLLINVLQAPRIKGVIFEYIAQDAFSLHEMGYPNRETIKPKELPESGEYHWIDGGESHIDEPAAVANIQDAVKNKNNKAYEAYSKKEYDSIKNCTYIYFSNVEMENQFSRKKFLKATALVSVPIVSYFSSLNYY